MNYVYQIKNIQFMLINFVRMKMKLIFFSLLSSIFIFESFAQSDIEVNKKLIIIQDAKIDSLVILHRKAMEVNIAHEEHDGIVGYRIQIYFDSGNNSKNRALSVKEEFDKDHTDIPSYIIFGEPYYRIRVGDFRTKLEAEYFLKKIKPRYPNAFVTQDKIKFPKLLD